MFSINVNQAIQIVVILMASVTLHEFAHAMVADRLGDPTPRRNGQISLNPTVHMDSMAMVFMALAALAGFLFAFGRTFVNPSNLKFGPQRGGAIVAAAGPLTNLLVAVATGFAYKILIAVNPGETCQSPGALSPQVANIAGFLTLAIEANLILFLFNLIPIPPLDGFTIVSGFLTPRQLYAIAPLVQYAPMLFLVFILVSFQTGFFVNDIFAPVFNRFSEIMQLPSYLVC